VVKVAHPAEYGATNLQIRKEQDFIQWPILYKNLKCVKPKLNMFIQGSIAGISLQNGSTRIAYTDKRSIDLKTVARPEMITVLYFQTPQRPLLYNILY